MKDVLELQFKSLKKRDNQIKSCGNATGTTSTKTKTRVANRTEEKIFEQNLFRKLGHTPTSEQPWDDQVSLDQSQHLRLCLYPDS